MPRGHRRAGPMSRRRTRAAACGSVALAAAGLLLAGLATGQSIQREGFEGREPLWQRGPVSDRAVVEESHMLTTQNAHSLPTSEYIRIKAPAGAELDPYV